MDDRIENWFTHRTPTPEQIERCTAINDAAKGLAYAIVANTPASPDQSAALRLVREAAMTAAAAITCGCK